MRILLLSDIHGNLEALDACLAAAPQHDLVADLGDIVGYGANPNEVVTRAQSLGGVVVRGNHDRAVTGLTDLEDFNPVAGLATIWTREHLTRAHLEWLRELPPGPVSVPELPDVQFVHGSSLDEDEYMVSVSDAIAPLLTHPVPITFYGHTHLQGGFSLQGRNRRNVSPRLSHRGTSRISPIGRYARSATTSSILVRWGSRAMATGAPPSPYSTAMPWIVSFHRVPYNVRVAQEKIWPPTCRRGSQRALATGR